MRTALPRMSKQEGESELPAIPFGHTQCVCRRESSGCVCAAFFAWDSMMLNAVEMARKRQIRAESPTQTQHKLGGNEAQEMTCPAQSINRAIRTAEESVSCLALPSPLLLL